MWRRNTRRLRPRPKRNRRKLTIMVAGGTGRGKSTLLLYIVFRLFAQLTRELCEKIARNTNEIGSTTDIYATDFLPTHGDNDHDQVWVRWIDTPGVGTMGMGIEPLIRKVKHYIEDKLAAHDESKIIQDCRNDDRVDLCLYFLDPKSIHDMDIKFMQALGEIVSVIPVISKADSMTQEERTNYITKVTSVFKENDINTFKPDTPLFALVCPEKWKLDLAVQNQQALTVRDFTRYYPWGSVDCRDPRYSDLEPLLQYFWGDHIEDLLECTSDQTERVQSRSYAKRLMLLIERVWWFIAERITPFHLFAVLVGFVVFMITIVYFSKLPLHRRPMWINSLIPHAT
eukprot:c13045_g2_i2.p1 GENE.c13045_g2_i2~~c13045_g2_i2.p1  ORF type:complete len:353 (-),score=93.80 c13045_g2_i2:101-1126(-)